MITDGGGSLTLVIGGAASGKSSFAEALAIRTGRPPVYIATAEAYDAEMKDKIAAHKASRGTDWTTLEAPRDLEAALQQPAAHHVVVIDCLTLWLSNLLLDDADLQAASDGLLRALSACPLPVIVVTNEVGQGIVPDHALGRVFRNAQGRLNQAVAAKADRVVQVVAGLPLWLKGAP